MYLISHVNILKSEFCSAYSLIQFYTAGTLPVLIIRNRAVVTLRILGNVGSSYVHCVDKNNCMLLLEHMLVL